MFGEYDPPEPSESESGGPCDSGIGNGFLRGALKSVFAMADPFEAFGEIFCDPEGGLVILVVVIVFAFAIILLVAVLGGLWSAVQEAFMGGGPPQGLGLK